MKLIIKAAAIGAGIIALSACNQTPAENAADNVEAVTENVADNMEDVADNMTNETAADAMDNQRPLQVLVELALQQEVLQQEVAQLMGSRDVARMRDVSRTTVAASAQRGATAAHGRPPVDVLAGHFADPEREALTGGSLELGPFFVRVRHTLAVLCTLRSESLLDDVPLLPHHTRQARPCAAILLGV